MICFANITFQRTSGPSPLLLAPVCCSHAFHFLTSVLGSHIFLKKKTIFCPIFTLAGPRGHEGQAVDLGKQGLQDCLWTQGIHSASIKDCMMPHECTPLIQDLPGVSLTCLKHVVVPGPPWSTRNWSGMLFERKVWKIIATLSSQKYFFHSGRIYRNPIEN